MTNPVSNCRIMGILNLTPDSFSGGEWGKTAQEIVLRFKALLESGANCVDIGAESTRPGAASVSAEEEWRRLEPAVSALRDENLLALASFDTRHPETMRKVAGAGCLALNCVGDIPSGEHLADLVAMNPNLQFMACHMNGTPATMQERPLRAHQVLDEVFSYFKKSVATLLAAGFRRDNIWLDPGIGFGKSDRANSVLISRALDMSRSERNILWGISRKGFLSRAFGVSDMASRDTVSKAVECMLALNGAGMIRTHDVAGLRVALTSLEAEV